jgi:hypothetical protein
MNRPMRQPSNKWSGGRLETELRGICNAIGRFPSNSDLLHMKRGDVANAIARAGGFVAVSDRMGVKRDYSDSDRGWDGEKLFLSLAQQNGFRGERLSGVKAPFDILLNDILRIDVKSASFADYKACRGWFYRIGKIPQADLVVLLQLDTRDFYAVPWWKCSTSMMTISSLGKCKYDYLKNNWSIVRRMCDTRTIERASVENVGSAIAV